MNIDAFMGRIWLILTIVIQVAITLLTDLSTNAEIVMLLVSMIIAIPGTILISKSIIQITTANKTVLVRKNYSIKTNLGQSGTITSPNFGLPDGYTILYRNSIHSPAVYHFYNKNGRYRGFKVVFGNGNIGNVDGVQLIQNISGNFSCKVTGPNGSQHVNWN